VSRVGASGSPPLAIATAWIVVLRKKSVVILSLSPIADDPRVRRQGQAFHDAGWMVTAIGIGASRSPAPEWRIIRADAPAQAASEDASEETPGALTPVLMRRRGPRVRLIEFGRAVVPENSRHFLHPFQHLFFRMLNFIVRCLHFVRRVIGRVIGMARGVWCLFRDMRSAARHTAAAGARTAGMASVAPPTPDLQPLPPAMDADKADAIYLDVFEIRRMYEAAHDIKADIYLANDWHMLPVARQLARDHGARFAYDTHEYAVEEYRYKPDFLKTKVPLVRGIEARGLREAAITTAVSAGIARDMAALHGVDRVPVEIRNVPNRVADLPEPRPTRRRMRVYFHGIITFDRGLEECIRSVLLWRPEFVFQMRGPIRPEFMRTLKAAIVEAGVWDRVEILTEVPMVELVRAAAHADIGISTPPSTSKHNIYALPNKFFEYIQAGLAMCVADLPDMRRIMEHYDLGLPISAVTPEAIAAAVNSFTPELVDRYKANARKAAAELNWEAEQKRFIALYEDAMKAA
jgi:glycosyltransferase involved in cell wall biosynthesis